MGIVPAVTRWMRCWSATTRPGTAVAGKVRAGFTPHVRRQVFAQLEPLHTARCPCVDLWTARPPTGVAA
jgi:hypothetical protein